MTKEQIITELRTLFYSFAGAVGTAAALAALQWFSVHIPMWAEFFTTVAGAYGTNKIVG